MRDGPDDRTDNRKHHRDASAPSARSISGESRASRASELSGISGTSGCGATPGLQPQNEQRESLRKVLPFALERKTGLALALRASGSRILADTPGPWKGRFEVACAGSLMHRHTKERGKNLLDSSLLFWSGKRISDPSIFLVHNQRITQSIFLKGHSRDAVIMHSFASQCFRQR